MTRVLHDCKKFKLELWCLVPKFINHISKQNHSTTFLNVKINQLCFNQVEKQWYGIFELIDRLSLFKFTQRFSDSTIALNFFFFFDNKGALSGHSLIKSWHGYIICKYYRNCLTLKLSVFAVWNLISTGFCDMKVFLYRAV